MITIPRSKLEAFSAFLEDGGNGRESHPMANLRTKILDSGGFDSSRILILRGGILRPVGKFPESLSQAVSAGTINLSWEIGRTASSRSSIYSSLSLLLLLLSLLLLLLLLLLS